MIGGDPLGKWRDSESINRIYGNFTFWANMNVGNVFISIKITVCKLKSKHLYSLILTDSNRQQR